LTGAVVINSIQPPMSNSDLFINYLKEHHASTFEDLYNQFENQANKCPICLEIVSKEESISHGSHILSCVYCFPRFISKSCVIDNTRIVGDTIGKYKIECCVCRGKCDNNDIETQYHTYRKKFLYKGEMVKCKRVTNGNDPKTYYFVKTKQGKKMATYTRMWLSTDGQTYRSKNLKFNRSNPPSKGDIIRIKKHLSDDYDVFIVE
jgi:hypothetical protein